MAGRESYAVQMADDFIGGFFFGNHPGQLIAVFTNALICLHEYASVQA